MKYARMYPAISVMEILSASLAPVQTRPCPWLPGEDRESPPAVLAAGAVKVLVSDKLALA
jgi:hypothetical protein